MAGEYSTLDLLLMNLPNRLILFIASLFFCPAYANNPSAAVASNIDTASFASAPAPQNIGTDTVPGTEPAAPAPIPNQRPTGATHNVQALFQHATQLAREGQDDEAIEAFQNLIARYPELPESYNNLAALYAKRGQYAQARATLETAISANPNYPLAYQNLGTIYTQLAILAYQQAATRDTHNLLSKQRQRDLQKLLRKNQPQPAQGTETLP